MKVLIINETDTAGGTEVQTKREYDMWKKEGEVPYCIFLRKSGDIYGTDRNVYFYKEKIGKIRNLKGKFFLDKRLYKFIKSKIEEINPDLIHINNIFYSPYAVYKAIGTRKCVQTLRDYKVICPKSTKCFPDWEICNQRMGIGCIRCILFSRGILCKMKVCAQCICFLKADRYRRKYVNKFITPSEKLKEYCISVNLPAICIHNPFDFSIMDNFHKCLEQTKIFLYYGKVAEYKGIKQLVEAFRDFSINKSVELHIVGQCDREILDWMKTQESPQIKIFDRMDQGDILKKLQCVYAVLVPSLWIENYPNTVLEGFAAECIVLASNRGGMTEQINDKNCIFDVLNRSDIVEKLEYAYYLSEDERRRIIVRQKEYLKYHNKIECYYQNLKESIECLC